MKNGDEKKNKSKIVGLLTGIGALITAIAALISATKGNNENELMIKSVYNVATESIPAIRERIAILEATCINKPIEMMIDDMQPPSPECQSDTDCDIEHICKEQKCVIKSIVKEEVVTIISDAPSVDKPKMKSEGLKIPKFEEIKQYIQQTGEVWPEKEQDNGS